MKTLTIAHSISLTAEQFEMLKNNKPVETFGVSVPVWFFKGNTSEPAEEVVCSYKLLRNSKNVSQITPKNYIINIPDMVNLSARNVDNQLINIIDARLNPHNTLHFKEYCKIQENNKRVNIVHSVELTNYAVS